MSKTIKYCLYSLASLLILVTVSLVTVVQIVDANRFKGIISIQLSRATGYHTDIQGDLSWQFYPWLGLKAEKIRIDGTAKQTKKPLMNIAQANFTIKLLPLLLRHIKIGHIVLKQPTINLQSDKKGRGNWQTSTAQPDDSPTSDHSSKSFFKLDHLSIKKISIENATLSFRDQRSEYTIKRFNLHSKNIQLHKTFPISLSGDVSSKQPLVIKGPFQFKGSINLNKQNNTAWHFQQVIGEGQLQFNPLTVEQLTLHQVSADLSLQQGQLTLKPLTAKLYGGSANATLNANLQKVKPVYQLKGILRNIQVKALLNDLFKINSIQGQARLNLTLNSQGKSGNEILRNLNGNASLAMHGGLLQGFNAIYLLDQSISVLKQLHQANRQTNNTQLKQLTGTATIRKGVIHNSDLLLDSAKYRVYGKGRIDLPKQYIDYRLLAEFLNLSKDDPLGNLQNLLDDQRIPIIVRGPFNNIKIQPDMKAIMTVNTKAFLEQQINNLLVPNPTNIPTVPALPVKQLFENFLNSP